MTSRLRILIDLLWPMADAPAPDATTISAMTWREIDRVAAQHRLRPMLHYRAAQAADWSVPEDIACRWQGAHRRSALKSLAQRVELRRIERLFGQAGLTGTVLKGGAFVWDCETDPARRPLRDLDILVDDDIALSAHRLLRAHGFIGSTRDCPDDAKHLPPLTSPVGIHVELHRRLIHTAQTRRRAAEANWRQAATLRARANATNSLAPTCPTDTLLHVILHSVLDHQFNNGPLLLLDMQLLNDGVSIEWPLFWTAAEALGARRACILALSLAQARGVGAAIEWPAGFSPAPPHLLRQAEAMMLIDATRLSELGWVGQIASAERGQRIARMRAMLLRRRMKPNHADDMYPKPGIRFSTKTKTVGRILQGLTRPSSLFHFRNSISITRWLSGI